MFLIHNGEYKNANQPLFTADSRGIRFGEGLFETMKLKGDVIHFAEWHMERLKGGMQLLKLSGLPGPATLLEQCMELARKNEHDPARIRLTVSGGEGSLFEEVNVSYTIESWPVIESKKQINTVVFREMPVSPNKFSHLKHNNFLPYILAAKYAVENNADEAILVNTEGNICEGTVSNLFIVKGETIFTPPLSEGCVAGIYRRYLLSELPGNGIKIMEKILTEKDLEDADEAFLTNSIQGIRSIMKNENSYYRDDHTSKLLNILAS